MKVKRLLLVAQVDQNLRDDILFSAIENDRVTNFCSLLFKNHDNSWFGSFLDREFVFKNVGETGGLIDSTMALEVKKEYADDNLDDDLLVLFVTNGASPSGSLYSDFLNFWSSSGYGKMVSDVFVLNIDKGNLKTNSDVRAIFEVKQITQQGVANYSSGEWAALTVQLAEFLIVTPSSRFDRPNQKYTLGYSGVAINIQEGKRYLSAKSMKWLIDRELKPVDLNFILGHVNPVIRKFKDRFSEIISQHVHPTCDDLYVGVTLENPSTIDLLKKYEERLKDSEVTADVERKIELLVASIRAELISKIDELNSLREKQAFVQAISGIFPEVSTGKPIRDWETLFELYNAPVASLQSLGIELELEQTQIMRRALDEAQDVNLLISDAQADIFRSQQLNRPISDSQEKNLLDLKSKLKAIKETSIDASEKCRSNYKNAFSQVSKDIIQKNADKIIQDAQYTPSTAPEALEPVFAPWVIMWMTGTIFPSLVWLIIDLGWMHEFLHWSITCATLVIIAWVIIIAKRLSRKKPEELDVTIEMKLKFSLACKKLADLYLLTASLRNFNRLMEEQVQLFLEIQNMDLHQVNPILEEKLNSVCLTIDQAFSSKNNEIALADNKSFERYFEEVFSKEVPNVPFLFQNKERVELFRHPLRKYKESVDHFFEEFGLWANQRSVDLINFALFQHLLQKREVKPKFLNQSLPTVEEIFQKSVVNLVSLNSKSAPQEAQIYIFRYENDQERPLIDEFDKTADRFFPESRTGNLQKIGTKNPNRVGFLKLHSIDNRDFVLDSTKDFFRKVGDSSDYRIKWVDKIEDEEYDNQTDFRTDLISLENENFVVYYPNNEIENERARKTLEYANLAVPELIKFFGSYGFSKETKGRKVPIYLAGSQSDYNRLFLEIVGCESPPIAESAGLCSTSISSDGSMKCNGIFINYQCRSTSELSLPKDINPIDLKVVLFHELAHYNHHFCIDFTRKDKYFNWEGEGVAVFFAKDWGSSIPSDAKPELISLLSDTGDYRDSYWVGYHALLLLNNKGVLDKVLKLSYTSDITDCIESVTQEGIDLFITEWQNHCKSQMINTMNTTVELGGNLQA